MNKKEIIQLYQNNENFQQLDYQYLFGIQIHKSGRKHVKIEHVYYCYTPSDFDYKVYKNFITELRDYEQKNNYEFGQNYNISRYEIFGNLYLYQLNYCGKDHKVNYNRLQENKLFVVN